jgi:membrane-bound lytic murein transglycosylase MltF
MVIKNALADAEAKKLKNLVVSFRVFGQQYNIDPMLLANQGYKGSRFDQKMKNGSGAVGIMQIKPSTAREKQIAINDVVSLAEDNIHAGAKYLRLLADTYIDDPNIAPRERVLMALAAYNAGPGNLQKFRDYSTKNGLDRNRWFGNVENGAAANALKLAGKVIQPISHSLNFDRAVTGISVATVLAVILCSSRCHLRQASSPTRMLEGVSGDGSKAPFSAAFRNIR